MSPHKHSRINLKAIKNDKNRTKSKTETEIISKACTKNYRIKMLSFFTKNSNSTKNDFHTIFRNYLKFRSIHNAIRFVYSIL